MGPVNWVAVVLAAAVAAFVLRLFWRGPVSFRGSWFYLLQIVPAAMLGHALARIGPDKLALKPHLYAMQSSGLALAIVIPALWMAGARHGTPSRETWRDSAAFLLAYLAMGGVFWLLG
ncbi:DUF1761 domain-containing protein [Novosphingobium sp.]|uniref:DUF1761 domain-containing protein n=1 Tax=Novosphingobium sp. TaxID=1874826 RepID=UPI0025D20624|nr:DUF1761 domain-containing protein [Novosphingobium sp.]MCC6926441.1 DUF1761 domain-containing protein [Novosphingobium sp.]